MKLRDIADHYVVFRTDELLKYVEKFKNTKMVKTGKIGFSFYIYPPDENGELFEDWQLKDEYVKNDGESIEPICEPLDNYKKIKQALK